MSIITLTKQDTNPSLATVPLNGGAGAPENIPPAMLAAGVEVVRDFYPAQWGGDGPISAPEATLLVRLVLEAAIRSGLSDSAVQNPS